MLHQGGHDLPLVLLTTHAPIAGSAGRAALDALRGPDGAVFDLIELLKLTDAERLCTYALEGRPRNTPPTTDGSRTIEAGPPTTAQMTRATSVCGGAAGAGGGLRQSDASGRPSVSLRCRDDARTWCRRRCIRARYLT